MNFKKKTGDILNFPLKRLGKALTIGGAFGIILLIIFSEFARGMLYMELENFDQFVGHFVRSFSSGRVTGAAVIITNLGSALAQIALALSVGGYLYYRLRNTKEAVILICNLSGSWLLNSMLKEIFKRSRPDIQHLVYAGGYSFPSGHAMVSASFYGMLGYLIWRNLRKRTKPSWYVIVLTVILIFLIGISRIYLGVHFASDVAAGFAAGGAWLIACIIALEGKKENIT